MYQSIKTGARVTQWVRSLDLTTHTSLSPIFTSNMCIHIIRSNRVNKLWLNDVFVSTFAAFNKRHTAFTKRHTTFAKLWLEKMHSQLLSVYHDGKLSFLCECNVKAERRKLICSTLVQNPFFCCLCNIIDVPYNMLCRHDTLEVKQVISENKAKSRDNKYLPRKNMSKRVRNM